MKTITAELAKPGRDSHEEVKVGQKVQARVLEVHIDRKRISLSLKQRG